MEFFGVPGGMPKDKFEFISGSKMTKLAAAGAEQPEFKNRAYLLTASNSMVKSRAGLSYVPKNECQRLAFKIFSAGESIHRYASVAVVDCECNANPTV